MDLRHSSIGRLYYAVLERFILGRLASLGLGPNHLTLAGPLLAALAPLGFWLHPLAGGAVILISALADSLDGLAARRWGKTTTRGAFLDSCMDRLADVFYLMGFWVLFRPGPHLLAAGLLIMASIASTFLISYAKARAESLAMKPGKGAMTRAPRVILLLIWSLTLAAFPSSRHAILWSGLVVYLAATSASAAFRITGPMAAKQD